jgi:dipeptidyl aminopeptidase/acylaminoacyl peptidase
MKHWAIRLWAVASGQEIKRVDHPYSVSNLLFSPDGSLLACSGYWSGPNLPRNGVSLWNVRTGKKFRQVRTGDEPLAFSRDGRFLAVQASEKPGSDSHVRVYEVATGLEARRFKDPRNSLHGAAFAPDGKTLATGCTDSSILLWPLTRPKPIAPLQGGQEAMGRDWQTLARFDAGPAYDAIWSLTRQPKSVAFLEKRLEPAVPADPQRLARLIADLDSKRFVVRRKAMGELERFGELAEPCLRKTVRSTSSLEVQRRVKTLLFKLDRRLLTAEQLQAVRAVAVLEYIATQEAQRLLKKLAAGTPEAPLTREAQAALQRLAKRPCITLRD